MSDYGGRAPHKPRGSSTREAYSQRHTSMNGAPTSSGPSRTLSMGSILNPTDAAFYGNRTYSADQNTRPPTGASGRFRGSYAARTSVASGYRGREGEGYSNDGHSSGGYSRPETGFTQRPYTGQSQGFSKYSVDEMGDKYASKTGESLYDYDPDSPHIGTGIEENMEAGYEDNRVAQCDVVKSYEEDLMDKGMYDGRFLEGTPENYKQRVVEPQWNMLGSAIFLAYVGGAIFYFFIRATKTLDIGWMGYAGSILFCEIFICASTIAYGFVLTKTAITKKTKGLPPEGKGEPDANKFQFDLRVMIPCYKEALDVVENTVRAALNADLPDNTTRTIYLCDDGADPNKMDLCHELGPDVMYVTGRPKEKGEINGKSSNLNNCLQMIYPPGITIPNTEILFILDADMVPNQNFFCKVLEVMAEEAVALCLTPQGYHNVLPDSDIFNNVNLAFWEYILPGYDAWGYVSCTGTNFALRASAVAHCGWFPTYTITEDYALGMELKRLGYKSIYMKEYLAYGEAPEDMRSILKQRSRWCKGQMQVFFSRHNPLIYTGLTFGMRILYFSSCWCYVTNMVAVPLAIIVPFLAMVFGLLPFVLNKWFALGASIYLGTTCAMNLYCKKRWHAKLMWFSTICNTLLWFTFSKAIFNVLLTKLGLRQKGTFKTTKKRGQEDDRDLEGCSAPDLSEMEGTKDYYVLVVLGLINLCTIIVVLYKLAVDGPKAYLMMMMFWSLFNLIPEVLFVCYSFSNNGRGRFFEDLCLTLLFASYLCTLGGVICIWLVPSEYQFSQVLGIALLFFGGQRSGSIADQSNRVPWRGDSALLDAYMEKSLAGGWYDAGDHIKSSYTIATATCFMAWGLFEFKKNMAKVDDNIKHGLDTIQWGADYLIKAHVEPEVFIAQVGNYTLDHSYWGRPEDMNMTRMAYPVDATRPGSDVLAAASAALAATAAAMGVNGNRQYAGLAMKEAIDLYNLAKKYPGSYSKSIPTEGHYWSDSFYDDLAWAACWLYKAGGAVEYLKDCETFYALHFKFEPQAANTPYFSQDHIIYGVDVLLATITRKAQYVNRVERWLMGWMTGSKVLYTPLGLAYVPMNVSFSGTGGSPLQYTANTAFLAIVWGKYRPGGGAQNFCWARKQIAYMLGDKGQSYVVGFGRYTPRKVPHRAASCPEPSEAICTWQTGYLNTGDNYHVLYGALVGGPDRNDQYEDKRDMNSIMNRVSLLNNAGFTGAILGLTGMRVSEAKCNQGQGLVQKIFKKANDIRY